MVGEGQADPALGAERRGDHTIGQSCDKFARTVETCGLTRESVLFVQQIGPGWVMEDAGLWMTAHKRAPGADPSAYGCKGFDSAHAI